MLKLILLFSVLLLTYPSYGEHVISILDQDYQIDNKDRVSLKVLAQRLKLFDEVILAFDEDNDDVQWDDERVVGVLNALPPTIKKLEIQGCHLKDKASAAISKLTNLKKLCFSERSKLKATSYDWIASLTKLEKLDLSDTDFTDDQSYNMEEMKWKKFKSFLETLNKLVSLQTLVLSENDLMPTPMTGRNKDIQHYNEWRTTMVERGAELLATHFHGTTLEMVSCNLGGVFLNEFACHCKKLGCLDISGNPFKGHYDELAQFAIDVKDKIGTLVLGNLYNEKLKDEILYIALGDLTLE